MNDKGNMYETIEVEYRSPTIKINFNRPDKANAMNNLMVEEIVDVLTYLEGNSSYKFLVFSGNGKVFSGGADMKEVAKGLENNTLTSEEIRNDQIKRQEFSRKFDNLDQITISAINGPMYGAGFSIAVNCDFRIMTESATACLPEIDRGMIYSGGGTPRLVNLIGLAKAKELIMLGKVIDSQESLKIGLVNEVVPDNKLISAVNELIEKLNKKPYFPLKLINKMVNASVPKFEDILMFEPDLQVQVLKQSGIVGEIKTFAQKNNILPF